ncbi:methionyl-tRNA formyltransferase [Thiolapillus brandeum]|uniref:Methionyl-tRNA formyltransferase n=1 Tax=Thiolapillus brandeum TaxID=1076588 RepID=A0A7U6GGQ2_9GAMM|nr:methionyl-tRNA formyltransferase [Thiolapillus brandeum]BAO43353.1 methionyl-tRNA formyltransferase [Thiolapillus brandeum]
MTEPLRIVFAGTPDFSVPPLLSLLESPHQVAAVYTQPDRPAGRGRKLLASPVKAAAVDRNIPVYQPASLRDPDAEEALRALNPDLMVVVAYGLLLPQTVLDIPRLGCVNIHASILPRWRGAAPIQRAIQAGDTESGVSIMRMDKGLDTGPVYLIRRIRLAPDETGGSLHDKLSHLGAEALMEALPGIADGSLAPGDQDHSQATYAAKLDKKEAAIDWHQSAAKIERQVRAFNPWPVAYTRYENANLRIWEAHAVDGVTAEPGTVMSATRDGVDVSTTDGLLRVTRLQMPGKRAMEARDFINAQPIQGIVLG